MIRIALDIDDVLFHFTSHRLDFLKQEGLDGEVNFLAPDEELMPADHKVIDKVTSKLFHKNAVAEAFWTNTETNLLLSDDERYYIRDLYNEASPNIWFFTYRPTQLHDYTAKWLSMMFKIKNPMLLTGLESKRLACDALRINYHLDDNFVLAAEVAESKTTHSMLLNTEFNSNFDAEKFGITRVGSVVDFLDVVSHANNVHKN